MSRQEGGQILIQQQQQPVVVPMATQQPGVIPMAQNQPVVLATNQPGVFAVATHQPGTATMVPQQSNVVTTVPQTGAAPQAYVVQTPAIQRTYPNYNSKRSLHLGITQLVAAFLILVFNTIGFAIEINQHSSTPTISYLIYPGIWSNVFVFLCGGFAICSAKSKSRCLIITHLVMGIFGSISGFILLAFALWALGEDLSYKERRTVEESKSYAEGIITVSMLYTLSTFTVLITCIWSTSLACNVTCCKTETMQANSGQQVVFLTGQPVQNAILQPQPVSQGQLPVNQGRHDQPSMNQDNHTYTPLVREAPTYEDLQHPPPYYTEPTNPGDGEYITTTSSQYETV